jgi:AraC-like DNA-binding protein
LTQASYLTPSAKIADYVKGIFVLERQGTSSFRLPLFANGTPTLVFQNTQDQAAKSPLILLGQTILPDELILKGKSTLIAYFFKPWCLPSLFRIAAGELTDKSVDFNFISKDHSLKQKLLNAESSKKMCSLLDDHIAALATRSLTGDPRVEYAAAQISALPQKDILTTVQKDLHMTERSFQRMFDKNVGVSPNQFRRIIQFNKAFQQLNNRKFSNLSDIAFDNGYADQSHFNRAFREFTDQTATAYLDSCPHI